MGQACLGVEGRLRYRLRRSLIWTGGASLRLGGPSQITLQLQTNTHRRPTKTPRNPLSADTGGPSTLGPCHCFRLGECLPSGTLHFMGVLQVTLARLAQVPVGETSQAGERRGLQIWQGVTRQRGG